MATTISIADYNSTEFAFPDDCAFRYKHYLKFMKHDFSWVKLEDYRPISKNWGFGSVGFIPLPKTTNNLIIDGFFQNEKYFCNIRENVIELFSLKDEYNDYIIQKYGHLFNENTCSLHIRRNDYATAEELKILDIEYYIKAVNHFGLDKTYVIFSDDLNWCKENLDFIPNKVFVEEGIDILELHIMSKFRNNIIANSTYSWWGAWMGNNNKVVMPDPTNNWFSDMYYRREAPHANFKDMYTRDWIVL